MSVLVCGGAGYIGSHTVAELLDRGEDPIIVDNLQKGHRGAVLCDKFMEGDIRDGEFMDRVFRENEIEAVIQFAADSLVGESVGDPLKYYNNNVVSTLCLLTKMKEYGVDKIVFSSTAATYGEPRTYLSSRPTRPVRPILTARQNSRSRRRLDGAPRRTGSSTPRSDISTRRARISAER